MATSTDRLTRYLHSIVADLARPGFAARARKFLVAVTGLLTQVLAVGVLPSPWDHRTQVALAVLTALAVYLTPNARDAGAGDSAGADGAS